MRRASTLGVKRGAWTKEEDDLLKNCIHIYGEGNWHKVPARAGLNRCRKSCRLRWYNYLHPDVRRGEFGADEIDLIIKMHKLLGNRWSLIAGRIPGRTANDIKNQWNTHILKKHLNKEVRTNTTNPKITEVIKPKPLKFSNKSQRINMIDREKAQESEEVLGDPLLESREEASTSWVKELLFNEEDGEDTDSTDVSTEKLFTSFYADGVERTNPSHWNAVNKEVETVWTDNCFDSLLEILEQ